MTRRLACAGIALIALAGCHGRGTDETQLFGRPPAGGETRFASSEVDFGTLRDRVLAPRCLRCHSELSSEADLLETTPYVVKGKPAKSPLFIEVNEGRMPRGEARLPQEQIDLVSSYIRNLAKKNGASTVPTPTSTGTPAGGTLRPTYASIRAGLLEKTCLKCHSTGSPGGNPVFDTYESVVDKAEEISFQLDFGLMPPPESSMAPPPEDAKTVFRAWIDAGFPR